MPVRVHCSPLAVLIIAAIAGTATAAPLAPAEAKKENIASPGDSPKQALRKLVTAVKAGDATAARTYMAVDPSNDVAYADNWAAILTALDRLKKVVREKLGMDSLRRWEKEMEAEEMRCPMDVMAKEIEAAEVSRGTRGVAEVGPLKITCKLLNYPANYIRFRQVDHVWKVDLQDWTGLERGDKKKRLSPDSLGAIDQAIGDTCNSLADQLEQGKIKTFEDVATAMRKMFGLTESNAQPPTPPRQKGSAKAPPLAVAPFTATAARQHQEAWAKHIGQPREATDSIGMKLVLIPSGEFMMGSGESAKDTAAFFNKTYGLGLRADEFEDEHPQHRVRITRPFYLGMYHVARGQFRQFVKDAGYKTDAEKGEEPGAFGWNPEKKEFEFNKEYSWRNAGFEQTDEHPVVNVSWNDTVAFCKWLSKKEGKSYRLPTEAEWEYACRAGTTTQYHSGDDPETLAKVANVADATLRAKFDARLVKYMIKASDGYAFTSPVGSFKPNAFGLYDMHGNAWQWCADWCGDDYYGKSPTKDPQGPDTGDVRVLRGGSWDVMPQAARSAGRDGATPDYRNDYAGFRVARTP